MSYLVGSKATIGNHRSVEAHGTTTLQPTEGVKLKRRHGDCAV